MTLSHVRVPVHAFAAHRGCFLILLSMSTYLSKQRLPQQAL